MTRPGVWLATLGGVALLQIATIALGLVPAAVVESVHVRGILPVLRTALGGISAVIPFSLAEAMIVLWALLGVAAIWSLIRRLARRRPRSPLRSGTFFVAASLAGLWLYLLGHGWTLTRSPLAARLDLPVVTQDEREAAYRDLRLATANALKRARAALGQPPAVGEVDFDDIGRRARAAILPVLREIASEARLPPGDVKRCIPSGLLMRFGVSGVFSPFTFEAHVDPSLHPLMLPFVAVHELAHVAGIAAEDEANFVAWLACTRSPDPLLRYSGHLGASFHMRWNAEMRRTSGVDVDGDRKAIRAHHRSLRSKPLAKVQRVVWDSVLKSQGVRSGIRSYHEVVKLMMAWEKRRR